MLFQVTKYLRPEKVDTKILVGILLNFWDEFLKNSVVSCFFVQNSAHFVEFLLFKNLTRKTDDRRIIQEIRLI